MKVFVHLNHGSKKGLLLSLNGGMTRVGIKRIIGKKRSEEAALKLIARSSSMVEVSAENMKNTQRLADFTISDDYTVERLG